LHPPPPPAAPGGGAIALFCPPTLLRHCMRLKLKVTGQGQDAVGLTSILDPSIEDNFLVVFVRTAFMKRT